MLCCKRVAGKMAMAAMLWLGAFSLVRGQQPAVHFWHPAGLPPGAIGGQQLARGGPLPGFFQPVEIRTPAKVLISLAEGGRFRDPTAGPIRVGLLVGQVYRLAAINLPNQPGVAVYPTIEIVDRLYTPRGMETRFPVQIELTREDLELAAQGKFVTRVVYVEDPQAALPAPATGDQSWFDVAPGMDPLTVADSLGRPIAIVRMGGRVPDGGEVDMGFLFGCPPVVNLPPPVAPPTESKSKPVPPAPKSRQEAPPK